MEHNDSPFLLQYQGYLRNLLRWDELTALWETLRSDPSKDWYLYAVGGALPEHCASPEQLQRFIDEIDTLLHQEHQHDYCGIVYVDNADAPSFIKIYDPNNLGSVCGPGIGPPPFPGWILSLAPPVDLQVAFPPPANRRRWWQKIFG